MSKENKFFTESARSEVLEGMIKLLEKLEAKDGVKCPWTLRDVLREIEWQRRPDTH